jgi:hypothetical protein
MVVAACCAAVALALPAAQAAAAPTGPENCPQPGHDPTTPWSQQLLAADRAWPLSRGDGQRIAVLDSGVDAGQPLLAGHVEAGFDAVANNGPANTDCLGSGTEVAGVMVGQQAADATIGIAPNAKVVPVRVLASPGSGPPTVDPGVLARAIEWSVAQRVTVICVSVASYTDDPRVATAVQHAESGGIPVVAAVGDHGAADDGNPKPYPAAYSGVIGVSAIDLSGARWAKSGHGSYVDIAAPGTSVLTTWRGQGTVSATGTGTAAGFVAATAAMVRHRWRTFSPSAVRKQLRATATPAAGGEGSPDFGAGILSPYGALTELASVTAPAPAPAFSPRTASREAQDWAAAWSASGATATGLTLAAVGLVLVLLVVAVAVPRGRRRSWRPTLARSPVDVPEPEELGPPLQLFGDK